MTNAKRTRRRPNLDGSHYYSEAEQLWVAWVTVGVKSDGSPDRRQRKAKTEAAVLAKMRKLEAQREAGKASRAGRSPTVVSWMTTYLDTICAQLVASGKMSPRTLDDYRSKNIRWIVPLLGQHRLDRLLPEHLDEAYAKMFAEGKSSSTVLKVHRILSRALTVAVRRGHVGHNVCKLVDAPEPADTEIEAFTREEARRILETVKGRRNGARWSVALALGIRQGEALGLRWSYLDLETGVIRVWFQVQRSEWRHGCDNPNACGQRWHRRPCKKPCKVHRHGQDCGSSCKQCSHICPKKTCDPKTCVGHARHCPQRTGGGVTFRPRKGKARLTLQCPPELLPILQAHREVQDLERMAAGNAWEDNDLVFCRPDGRPIDRSDDWRDWKDLLTTAGVRDGRLHDARHTAGSLLVEQDVHIRVVQEILGHTRVTTTEKYTHVASPQSRDASERMGRALWGEG